MNRTTPGRSIAYSSRKNAGQQRTSKKKWWIAIIALLFLLTGGGVWAKYFRVDPRLAALHELRQQLESDNLPSEQRRELRGQMRQQMEQLPPELQRQEWQSGRPRFEAQAQKRMAEFFALSRKDRLAALDKEIARQERRRKEREQQRDAGGVPNGTTAQAGQAGAVGGGQAGQGGGPGNRGNFANMSPEQRAQMRRDWLDNGSPQTRAQMTEYRQEMNQRRQEMGLPPMRGFGPRR